MRLPLRCVFKVDMHYKDIFSFNHLLNSYNRARRDNREKHSVCRFDFFLENNLLKLKYELQFNSYYPFPYTCFIVTDPKKRNIAAPHFRDRVVQHALVSAIEPLFDKSFIKDAYACRSKKGTHYGARRMKKFLTSARCIYGKNTPLYILQCDIKKFFPFVSWDILLTLIKKKIICKKTLSLIETILTKHRVANKTGSINSFPPEIVSTTERKGLPIGNLTSQLFANVYLNPLDHFVKENLRERWYGRYMDDFFIIHYSKKHLCKIKLKIQDFLSKKLQLSLHPKKSIIQNVKNGVAFVGYRIFYDHILIRASTLRRFQKKYHRFQKQEKNKIISKKELMQKQVSFCGHLKHANAYNLKKSMF